jgi:hypothetical protein
MPPAARRVAARMRRRRSTGCGRCREGRLVQGRFLRCYQVTRRRRPREGPDDSGTEQQAGRELECDHPAERLRVQANDDPGQGDHLRPGAGHGRQLAG